jgi:hypothetical protein
MWRGGGNDLCPGLLFCTYISANQLTQIFVRHTETNAVLYSKSLAYSMAFTRNSFLFILTYWLNSSYNENFCEFLPLLSSHPEKKSSWQFLSTSQSLVLKDRKVSSRNYKWKLRQVFITGKFIAKTHSSHDLYEQQQRDTSYSSFSTNYTRCNKQNARSKILPSLYRPEKYDPYPEANAVNQKHLAIYLWALSNKNDLIWELLPSQRA